MTTPVNILLDKLKCMEKDFVHRALWDLFERRDRLPRSNFGDPAAYVKQLGSQNLNVSCGKWALEVIQVLDSLNDEIRLLFFWQGIKWDLNILVEAVNLLQFLMNFLGDLQILKDACKRNSTQPINHYGHIDTFGNIAVELKRKQNRIFSEIDKWLEDRPEIQRKLSEEREPAVSAASFRELIIRNQLLGLQLRVFKGKKYRSPQDKLQQEINEIRSGLLEKIFGKEFCKTESPQHAWIPRTIVVIWDETNRMLLTGATQPACDYLMYWREVTRTITRHRLGGQFAETIDQCSIAFHKQVNFIKKKEMQAIEYLCSHFDRLARNESEIEGNGTTHGEKAQVDEIYSQIVTESQPDVKGDFREISKSSKIVCLALNGYSFTFEPACLRCQWLYPGWKHWKDHRTSAKTTKDAQEKIAFISKQMESHLVTKSDPKKVAYCAESVAAAKLFSLRAGKLALV